METIALMVWSGGLLSVAVVMYMVERCHKKEFGQYTFIGIFLIAVFSFLAIAPLFSNF